MRVLVVPEDPTHNGYILKPLVERMMSECGRPHAKVTILTNPRAQGYDHAKRLIAEQILDRYAHMDLILFLPDADGRDRSLEFNALKELAETKGVRLLCCAAVQEVEVWLLAGHLDRLNAPWPEIRKDRSVKENVFDSFLAQYGDARRAGGGRDQSMNTTLNSYGGLIQRCPELGELEREMREILN